MNKQAKFLLVFIFMILAVGCGDSDVRELRGEFIDSCKTLGLKRDICSCIFEKVEDNYTKDQLLGLKNGILPKDYSEFTTKATMVCLRED